jgi:hypothetical protein
VTIVLAGEEDALYRFEGALAVIALPVERGEYGADLADHARPVIRSGGQLIDDRHDPGQAHLRPRVRGPVHASSRSSWSTPPIPAAIPAAVWVSVSLAFPTSSR